MTCCPVFVDSISMLHWVRTEALYKMVWLLSQLTDYMASCSCCWVWLTTRPMSPHLSLRVQKHVEFAPRLLKPNLSSLQTSIWDHYHSNGPSFKKALSQRTQRMMSTIMTKCISFFNGQHKKILINLSPISTSHCKPFCECKVIHLIYRLYWHIPSGLRAQPRGLVTVVIPSVGSRQAANFLLFHSNDSESLPYTAAHIRPSQ